MPDFVVEDGTIVDDASSYISMDDADDYLSVKPNSTAWADVEESTRESYLMWATRLLDQRAFFVGSKTDEDSALRWPRQGVIDRDGLLLASDEIPKGIKDATVEIAYHLFSQSVDPSAPPSTSAAASGIKKIVAAEVSIEYQDAANLVSNNNLFPGGINRILSPYGSLAGAGSGFGLIRRV